MGKSCSNTDNELYLELCCYRWSHVLLLRATFIALVSWPGTYRTKKISERQRVTQNGSVSKHWFCARKSPANVRYHVPGCHLCTTYIAALYSGQKRPRASCLAQGGFGDTVAFPAVLRVLTVKTLSQLASLTRRCEAWTSLHVFRAHARVHTVLVVTPVGSSCTENTLQSVVLSKTPQGVAHVSP